VDLLISIHVESIAKVVWGELSLLVCSSLGTVGIALLSQLSLFVGFAFNNRFVIADVENQVSSSGWKDWEAGKPQRVRW